MLLADELKVMYFQALSNSLSIMASYLEAIVAFWPFLYKSSLLMTKNQTLAKDLAIQSQTLIVITEHASLLCFAPSN